MWGWIASALVTLLGTVFVLHYRSLTADSRVSTLLEENKLVLATANSVLAELAAKANLAGKVDADEAKKVTNAKTASDFLNASSGSAGMPATGPGRGPSAQLQPSRRPKPSGPIHGFARGPGNDSSEPGSGTGSLDSGRVSLARSRYGMYEEWC